MPSAPTQANQASFGCKPRSNSVFDSAVVQPRRDVRFPGCDEGRLLNKPGLNIELKDGRKKKF